MSPLSSDVPGLNFILGDEELDVGGLDEGGSVLWILGWPGGHASGGPNAAL